MRKKKQETKQKKNAGRDLPTRKRKKNQTTKRWDSLLASPIGNCSVLLRFFLVFFFILVFPAISHRIFLRCVRYYLISLNPTRQFAAGGPGKSFFFAPVNSVNHKKNSVKLGTRPDKTKKKKNIQSETTNKNGGKK